MNDGIKIPLRGEDCNRFRQENRVQLIGEHDLKTGNDFETARGLVAGLRIFSPNPYYLEIRGSLHRYYNAEKGLGAINHTQFTYDQSCEAIAMISDLVRMEPNDIELLNLELGLNLVNPPIPAAIIIRKALMLGTQPFHRWRRNEGFDAQRTQYKTKGYDKGIIENLDFDLFRFERAVTKMQAWNKAGIKVLGDLYIREKWEAAFEILCRDIRSLLFFPFEGREIEEIRFNKYERLFLSQSQHLGFWENLATKSRQRKKERLLEIAAKHGALSINSLLIAQANETFHSLLNPTSPEREGEFYRGAGMELVQSRGEFYRGAGMELVQSRGEFYPLDNRVILAPPPVAPPPSPLPELDVDQDQQQVEADSEARPLPTCKVCLNPIEGRGKGAATCSQQCKSQADAKAKRAKRRAGKYGNEPGRLFRDSA